MEDAVKLLLLAGFLLLISGAIFGFGGSWLYAGLLWCGAFGMFVAVLNLKQVIKQSMQGKQ